MLASDKLRQRFRQGHVIPACPLALNSHRKFDERRQRALVHYYMDAGAGGLAAAVHTTQFAIRDPQFNLFKPVLELVSDVLRHHRPDMLRIGGICGLTPQATAEAGTLVDLNYEAGLLSLGAWRDGTQSDMLEHCRQVSRILPIVGFYLQPAVGGRLLNYEFWREFLEIENIVAIKIAPFNRYQTIDVMRAVFDSGRSDVALYTGNDDNIVPDLITTYRFAKPSTVDIDAAHLVSMQGGLLGQWAVGTRAAVQLLERCKAARESGCIDASLLQIHGELTDFNAALFDAANHFHGCIAGIHEVLRRQGLLEGIWCLDPQRISVLVKRKKSIECSMPIHI